MTATITLNDEYIERLKECAQAITDICWRNNDCTNCPFHGTQRFCKAIIMDSLMQAISNNKKE